MEYTTQNKGPQMPKSGLGIFQAGKVCALCFILSLAIPMTACASDPEIIDHPDTESPSVPDTTDQPNNNNNSMKIKMITSDRTITATLVDNAATQDFLSRLPLEIEFEDYNRTEKIFYPSPKLNIDGVKRGCAPVPGDITIYAPWGNVAIFYKSWSQSSDLIRIGHIDGDGIEALKGAGSITVRIEKQ